MKENIYDTQIIAGGHKSTSIFFQNPAGRPMATNVPSAGQLDYPRQFSGQGILVEGDGGVPEGITLRFHIGEQLVHACKVPPCAVAVVIPTAPYTISTMENFRVRIDSEGLGATRNIRVTLMSKESP